MNPLDGWFNEVSEDVTSIDRLVYTEAGVHEPCVIGIDARGNRSSEECTVVVVNTPPDCSDAEPSLNVLWPPNHKSVFISVIGITDADGDPVSISVESIFQDEPVNDIGDGSTATDGWGIWTEMAEVRAERSGSISAPGDGRVYHIGFTASDDRGGSCSGVVKVGVPHNRNDTPVDGGPLYDSTIP
jgi:hypothetical protein